MESLKKPKVTPAYVDHPDALPNTYSCPKYTKKCYINIQGDYNYVKSKIEKYALENNFLPGFKITDLKNGMYDLSEIKQTSEP